MKRDWLVSIRKKHELTQSDVAETVKTSPAHYSDIETGRRAPSSQLAMRIAVLLEFPVHWLFVPEYLHNAEKSVLRLAMQLDFPDEEIFLNTFPHFAEKIKSYKKSS